MGKTFKISDLEKVFSIKRDDSGTLISVIGFDGSGKTTQIEAIAAEYRKHKRDVLITVQPTDWFRNQPINRHFLEHGGTAIQARILALMSAADRLNHVHEVILPALNAGKVVICDRYVYAAFGVFIHRGLDAEFISNINQGLPKPDYAFYLNVSPKLLIERLNNRDSGILKYEEREVERIVSITDTYKNMGSQLINIDGNQDVEQVTSDMLACISPIGDLF